MPGVPLPVVVFGALLAGPALAQSESEMQRLRALDERCYKAREAKLKILQAEKVQECVSVERRAREDCEKYWEGYGWGTMTPHGRLPRFFDDIPECLESFNAWQNSRRR